ncbi:hypothetical protein DBR43_06655 [Pedobacter sp. KBW06]|nr:hypothetical protein DBR43_06655 [Pedobacter sp. KBW06]
MAIITGNYFLKKICYSKTEIFCSEELQNFLGLFTAQSFLRNKYLLGIKLGRGKSRMQSRVL